MTGDAAFVRACDGCGRNIALAAHRANGGRCHGCRVAADAAAARRAAADDWRVTFAAGAAGAAIVVLVALAAWWLGVFGARP